jgi:DNA-binding transcriptional ArsR family regulator
MESGEVVGALGALAQETRLEALRLLVRAGPRGLAAGEIARRLGVPAPTLSFHLRALAHAGLVRCEREGRVLRYRADFETLRGVVAFLTEHCCADAPARPAARGRRRA